MHRFSLLIITLCLATSSRSQALDFSAKQKLFDSPIFGLLDFPFLPFDFNKDGLAEFVGREGEDLILYSKFEDSYTSAIINSDDLYSRPFESMDFNEDGFEDIILARYVFLYNDVTGSYDELRFTDSTTNVPSVVGVADFDGNGFKDLLTIFDSGTLQTGMSIQYFDGSTFETFAFPESYRPGPIRIGDLEGDGDIDVAFVNKFEKESPKILVNDGAGGFIERDVLAYTFLKNRTMDFEDLDNDGDLDLLVINTNDEMKIYENTDNYISPPFQYEVADNTNSIITRVADLNDDGEPEIISFDYGGGLFSLNIYQADEALDFKISQTLTSFNGPTSFTTFNPNYISNTLSIYDFESDGDLDIILSYTLDDTPAVWLLENFQLDLSNSDDKILENIAIFPNPASDYLNIEMPQSINEQFNYTIYNNVGQQMGSGKLEQQISIGQLNIGTYFLQVSDGQRQWMTKFELIK